MICVAAVLTLAPAPQSVPDLVRELAPVLILHPDEEYHPVDPMQFIEHSRFRHHKGFGLDMKDEGWSKVRRGWVSSNSRDPEYFDIPLDVISRYGPHPDGRNRRPRDANSGSKLNVFLDPEVRLVGSSQPDGVIPTFAAWSSRGNRFLAQYWFFFGYSDGWMKFNHEGDWEVIAVHYDLSEQAILGAQFSAHGNKEFVPMDRLHTRHGGRVVGYCSKGTHAIYPRPGSYRIKRVHTDRASAEGYAWFTWLSLEPLRRQPWRNFAGAWGEVGEFAETTGPLGPWHKLIRLEGQGGDIPSSPGVFLYEHKNFGGRRVFVGDSVRDLKRNGAYRFGDKASSLTYHIPQGWRMLLYEHDNFRGSLGYLEPGKGRIDNLHEFGAGDKLSSLAWEEIVQLRRDITDWGSQESGIVTLYEHDGFRGSELSFGLGQSCSDLKPYGFGDKTSSVAWEVPAGWTLTLYKHHGYREPVEILTGSGSLRDLKPRRTGDTISSLRWARN